MNITAQPAIVFTFNNASHAYLPAEISMVTYRRIRPNDANGMFHVMVFLKHEVGYTNKHRWYLTGDELAELDRLLSPYKIEFRCDFNSASSAKDTPGSTSSIGNSFKITYSWDGEPVLA